MYTSLFLAYVGGYTMDEHMFACVRAGARVHVYTTCKDQRVTLSNFPHSLSTLYIEVAPFPWSQRLLTDNVP